MIGGRISADRPDDEILDDIRRSAAADADRHHDREERAGIREQDGDGGSQPTRCGICVADVVPESVTWLWSGRIPASKPTILDGDPGLGKSTLTLEIAARISRGDPLHGDTERRAPRGALILSAEDGLGDTIRPRLEAAGADLTRVYALPTLPTSGGGETLPELPRDVPRLERLVREIDAALVIVDPLMAYLGSETSSHRDQDVRRALAPLAKLCEDTGAALLVVRHLNKRADGNPLYRGGGSIGIIGAARSGLLVGRDPDDEDRRVLASTKSNLCRPPDSLSWRLVDVDGVARVQWLGASTETATTLMAAPMTDEERGALDEAVDVLREILADGPVAVGEIRKQARRAGVSDRTLDRAKERLRVRSHKRSFGAGWSWELPDGPKSANLAEERQAETLASFGGLGVLRGPDGESEELL